jgi:tRNA pseudouridine38-40 synthase
MRTIRLVVRYDGGAFAGWQRQPGFPTVQQALEEAIARICGQTVVVHGSGRTDSGVHALRQIAHFRAETRLQDHRWVRALNAHLPTGAAVTEARTVDDEFHARFSAIGKRYAYVFCDAPVEDPLTRRHVWWAPYRLDLARMREAARHLVGRHDWRSFQTTGSSAKTSVRTVRALHLWRRGHRIALVVQADGFLYNMVRAFAGTLAEVGRGALEPGAVLAMREARDRRAGGPTAPAHALYLVRALYPRGTSTNASRTPASTQEITPRDRTAEVERIPFD